MAEIKIRYGNPDKEARAKTAAGSDANESQVLYQYLILGGAAYEGKNKIPHFINSKGAERIEKIKEVVAKIFKKEAKAEKKAREKAEKEEAKAKEKAEREAEKIAKAKAKKEAKK